MVRLAAFSSSESESRKGTFSTCETALPTAVLPAPITPIKTRGFFNISAMLFLIGKQIKNVNCD
jgi:hypothetical protein